MEKFSTLEILKSEKSKHFFFPQKNKIKFYKKAIIDKDRCVVILTKEKHHESGILFTCMQKVWQTGFGLTYGPYILLPYEFDFYENLQLSMPKKDFDILNNEGLFRSYHKGNYQWIKAKTNFLTKKDNQ